MGCPWEPRSILAMVNERIERIVLTDHMLKTIWPQHMLLPRLRNPAAMDELADFLRTMLGE
eukprot:6530337-Prorocentrum_lima.AAC.1